MLLLYNNQLCHYYQHMKPHHQIFRVTPCFPYCTLYCRQIFCNRYVLLYGLMGYGRSPSANLHEQLFLKWLFFTGKHFMFNEAYYCRWLYRFYQEHSVWIFCLTFFAVFLIPILFNSFSSTCPADGSCTLAQIAGTEKSLVCMGLFFNHRFEYIWGCAIWKKLYLASVQECWIIH